jgi:hypothetical protein
MHPDTCIEIEEFVQSSEPKKSRSSVIQHSEQNESNYFLGHPLHYSPTNILNTSQIVGTIINVEHVLLNPENLPITILDIQNVENVNTDKKVMGDLIEESFNDIKKYMEIVLTNKQLSHYLAKLVNLKTNHDWINYYEEKFQNLSSICSPFDCKFIEILDKLLVNFDVNAGFNQEDFDKFKKELNHVIICNNDILFLKGQIRIKSYDERKLLFYTELKNCSKHFRLIPELMTLTDAFNDRSIDNIIILIHSINLMIEKRKNSPVLKIFVLFLVKRIFEYSKGIGFDVFTIDNITTDCPKNQLNLYFFIWEFDVSKRRQIKCKNFYNEPINCSATEKLRLRIVLLIFLYQQIIFLKWNNASYSEFQRYTDLIKRVIKNKKCPGCDYDEYLKLLENYK